jgi:hypothetical protein
LTPDRETDLLIDSIAETSKHSRNVLYIPLAASFYILLSALTGRHLDDVELPVLQVTVTSREFLALGPLIILALYLYLHIYLADLFRKLRAFDELQIQPVSVSDARMLVFPWLPTLIKPATTFEGQRRNVVTPAAFTYVALVNTLLLWLSAPIVLFVLWLWFVGKQDAISLVPCLSLIVACFGSSSTSRNRSATIIVSSVIALALLSITVISVPEMRSHGTSALWVTISGIARRIGIAAARAAGSASTIIAYAVVGVAAYTKLFLYETEQSRLTAFLEEAWLRLDDRGVAQLGVGC